MESAADVAIFSRAVERYGYYGDSHRSSFMTVDNIYPNTKVIKYKCIGQYQKRVGNRLGKLHQRVKGLGGKAKAKEILTTMEDGRIMKTPKKAKGKLTDALIDMLQNYFGLARIVVESVN